MQLTRPRLAADAAKRTESRFPLPTLFTIYFVCFSIAHIPKNRDEFKGRLEVRNQLCRLACRGVWKLVSSLISFNPARQQRCPASVVPFASQSGAPHDLISSR